MKMLQQLGTISWYFIAVFLQWGKDAWKILNGSLRAYWKKISSFADNSQLLSGCIFLLEIHHGYVMFSFFLSLDLRYFKRHVF